MMHHPDKDFHNFINPINAKYVYAPFFYVSTTLSIPSLPKETTQKGWKSSRTQTSAILLSPSWQRCQWLK